MIHPDQSTPERPKMGHLRPVTPVEEPLTVSGQHRRAGSGWITAFAITLALHLGVAGFFLIDFAPAVTDDDGGYMAIDLVAPPSSPKVDAPDVAIGEESPEVAASNAAMTPPSPVIPDDTPPIPAAKTDEAMVKAETQPTPPEEKPPEDVKPDPTQHMEVQSEAAAPSEAKAPPKIEAPVDDHPAAPPIIGKSDADIRDSVKWNKLLGAHLDRNKRFPVGQRADRRAYEVKVQFQLSADGHVLSARVITSSGNAAFDEAALATMRRASPVPAPPASLLAKTSFFNMPVIFNVRD